MAKLPKMNLPSAADLFSTQEIRDDAGREKVRDIPLVEIDSFHNHPFRVTHDESMNALAESIKSFGVKSPALVRPKEGGRFELISGHRRKMACELAGLEVLPCIVREMDNDEAAIILVDSNLQRESILPSEKAKSYKMKLDAIRRKAGRPANNRVPVGPDFDGKRSREILAENSPDSNTQILRYIRLTELIPPLLDMVDEGRIAMRPAVELSYLMEEIQQFLLEAIEQTKLAPSQAQAEKMRKLAEEGRLDADAIGSIMREVKPATEQFKMPKERIVRFFPAGTPAKTMESKIVEALEFFYANKQ